MSQVDNTLFHFEDGRPSFEDLGLPNGITHWSEEVLMNALGYATQASFQKAITRAKQACLSAGLKLEEHISIQANGSHIFTRFGCYMVAMNGDVKKPEVAAAQAYFAAIAETFESHLEHTDGIERILIREEITDIQKALASTSKSHGAQKYGLIQHQGYLGMYNMSLARLAEFKGVDKKEFIDRMGKDEMAAHLFRITQTEAKIRRDNIQGQDQVERAAKSVGKEVRNAMINIGGVAPENLPVSEHVKDVKKKLKDTSKNMKAIDGQKHQE